MTPDPRPAASRPTSAASPADSQRAPSPARLEFHRRRESTPTVHFGMRSLLIVISAAAVLLAIATTLGGNGVTSVIVTVAASVCMVLMPVCIGTLALSCGGMRRTYFLGAFMGCILPYFGGLGAVWRGSMLGVAGYFAVAFTTALLSGYVALVTRRYAERRGWHLPSESADLERDSPSSK